MKKETITDRVMNRVTLYGGVPVRYGDMVQDMDRKAKEYDSVNWMQVRDAGLAGHDRYEITRPFSFPADVQPLTLQELEIVTNLGPDDKVPPEIWAKWITMYPKEDRWRYAQNMGLPSRTKQRGGTSPGIMIQRSASNKRGVSRGECQLVRPMSKGNRGT
jgi:hypothetical protein